MTNSEFIDLLAKSIRDPSKNWGNESYEAAANVAKSQLIDLVNPEQLETLTLITEVSVTQTLTGFGGYDLQNLSRLGGYYKDISLIIPQSSGRPIEVRRVGIDSLGNFQRKYSGATEDSPVYTVIGNKIYTLGRVAFTGLFTFLKKAQVITISSNGSSELDIPERFLMALIDLSQSILYRWDGDFELSTNLYATQYQLLTGKRFLAEQGEVA